MTELRDLPHPSQRRASTLRPKMPPKPTPTDAVSSRAKRPRASRLPARCSQGPRPRDGLGRQDHRQDAHGDDRERGGGGFGEAFVGGEVVGLDGRRVEIERRIARVAGSCFITSTNTTRPAVTAARDRRP